MDITPYLRLLIEKQGSDIFFIPGAPVKMKVDGIAVNVGKTLFTLLLGFVWVQIQLSAVEQDCNPEILKVPEPSCD